MDTWYSRNREISRQRAKQWALDNKDRANELKKEWARLNRGKVRASRTKASWKSKGIDITLEEYTRLYSLQKGACKICGRIQIKKRLGVDHCHETGKIRGLLCAACNIGIGCLKHDPKLLQKAIDYLVGGLDNHPRPVL